jgi:hypothetical protein
MKRILLFTALGLAALLFVAPGAFAFGTKDVVRMSQDGVSDQVIITKIENSGKIFRLDADDIEHLKDDGVSDKVIEAMLKTESYAGDDEYYDDHAYPYRAYVYDPYYYGYYPYYYPRSGFSFGLGLDFGHRYYGHSYDPRRYYPYSGGGSFGTTRERSSVGSRSGWSGSGSTGSTSGGSTWSGRSSGSRTRTR